MYYAIGASVSSLHRESANSLIYMCVCIVSDINECVENRDNCEQLCFNRAGAFTCSCRPGYQLDSDGRSCTGKYCVGLWQLSCSCAPLL